MVETKPKPRRTRSRKPTSSQPAAASELDAFARFCGALTLEDGRGLTLEPFQRTMLTEFFGGASETLIVIPKKNGKSTLLAALALFHLLTTPDAECVIAAASRDQATILYDQAAGFVRRSEQLQLRIDIKRGYREIRSRKDSGRVRVLAADVDTADGVIPTLALVDELHRHKSSELYGVFRDGLGPRDGRMVTISTAGASSETALGVMRETAHKLPSFRRDGAHNHAATPDRSFVLHEWALDDNDDLSPVNAKAANPASWQTVDELSRRHDSPSMTPWAWARFACGVWMNEVSSWISRDEWDACAGAPGHPGDGVFVGVDIGLKKDSSAIALTWWRGDRLHVKVEILTPSPGQPLAVADIRARIGRLNGELDLREVAYDPWGFRESAEELLERGVPMIEFPPNNSRMVQATEKLYELIRDRRLVHDGDPELRAHVLAAVPMETERGVRISKRKSRERIDACMALATAVDRAVVSRSAKPVRRGAVFV